MSKKVLLTGDRPTGKLHLGHLVGSLQNRVKMQDEYEAYLMVADVQALTDNYDNPQKVRDNVFEVVADNLSVGIDPEKITYFIQSQIPEIAELTVFFSNMVTVSELQRNPTVKNEISEKGKLFKDGNVTFGFLGYPVSQAADISFLRAEFVPVGEDQIPVIEQSNRITKKFNKYYGDIFPHAKCIVGETPRLLGLDGKKMSKSLNNAIYLSDSAESVDDKIKKAKTDSDNLVKFDQDLKPEVSTLMQYYKIATGKSFSEIEKEFKDIKYYSEFKQKLSQELNKFLDPIRERRKVYEDSPKLVWDILEEGRKKVSKKAKENLDEVKEKMKIKY
jgi:tryptophanyl-tRNA synthetase